MTDVGRTFRRVVRELSGLTNDGSMAATRV